MPTKLICHTPDCVSCGADGTCKLAGEIRVDQKRCQSLHAALHPIYGKGPGSVRTP